MAKAATDTKTLHTANGMKERSNQHNHNTGMQSFCMWLNRSSAVNGPFPDSHCTTAAAAALPEAMLALQMS
jgi:hypothetical protein